MDICTTIDPDTGREVASMWKDEFLHLVEIHNKLLSWAERQGHGDPCGVWDDSVPKEQRECTCGLSNLMKNAH